MRHAARIIGVFLALCSVALAVEFPAMTVATLADNEMVLPQDFSPGPTVLVLVYDQSQQGQADTWLPFLDTVAAEPSGARYFLMPVLPAGLSIVRGLVESAIRDSAADTSQLERTILLFTDVAALQSSLGIERTDSIHLVVLGSDGAVLASARGPYTVEASWVLTAALTGPVAGESGLVSNHPDQGRPLP